MALECVSRAQAVASVTAEVVGQKDVSPSDIQNSLQLIDDLLHIIPLLHWWRDEEQLIDDGWQPPKTQEGRV